MTIQTLRRRIPALGTVLTLGIALPFAVGATPAHAQAQLDITKTHAGVFTRGGESYYQITVTNSGDQPTGATHMTDVLPPGLTVDGFQANSNGFFFWECPLNSPYTVVTCNTGALDPGEGYTMLLTVDVAQNAPCTVTNTATIIDEGGLVRDSASDPTDIPGGNCAGGDGGGGDGGSILPVNLSGVLPMFNNITTNNNLNSPGAANVSNQDFRLNTPE